MFEFMSDDEKWTYLHPAGAAGASGFDAEVEDDSWTKPGNMKEQYDRWHKNDMGIGSAGGRTGTDDQSNTGVDGESNDKKNENIPILNELVDNNSNKNDEKKADYKNSVKASEQADQKGPSFEEIWNSWIEPMAGLSSTVSSDAILYQDGSTCCYNLHYFIGENLPCGSVKKIQIMDLSGNILYRSLGIGVNTWDV